MGIVNAAAAQAAPNAASGGVPVYNSTAVAVQMGDAVNQPNYQSLEGVRFDTFGTQIDVQSGQYWHVARFDMHNAAQYAIRVRNVVHNDAGDGNITGGTIYADGSIGVDGIRVESGGGLKIKGTKVLQFQRAVALQVADGPGTSDLLIDSSNSFENQTSGYCVRLGRANPAGTANWLNIRVEAQCVGGTEVYAGVSRVQLGGIMSFATYGYRIAGGDTVTIMDGATVFGAGAACVDVADPATNVQVGQVNRTSSPAVVVDERTTGAGPVRREHTRPLNLAQSASYTPIYRIDMPGFRGARVTLQIEGTIANKGVVNSIVDDTLSHNGTSVVVGTATPAVTAGYGVDVQFDTTSVPGSVIVGVRPNAAVGGGALTGSASIKVEGKSLYFKVL